MPIGVSCPKHEVSLEEPPLARSRPGLPGVPLKLVTLGRFGTQGRTEAIRIRLEAEGIPTFIQGERMGSQSMYQVATGGLALQVPADLASEARVILSQSWAPPSQDDDLDEAWEDLAPEPWAYRLEVMGGVLLAMLGIPLLLALIARAMEPWN